MAETIIKTRFLSAAKTTEDWGKCTEALKKGEISIEIIASSAPKFKVGDGVNLWKDLPYATMTPDQITSSISGSSHSHSNKSTLDQIQAALTTALKTNYDKAYTHSTAAHAPSNAQANVIESVQVNGSALTPSSKAVNITVPTKTSQLTNDSGFKTTDTNTTYTLETPASAANGSAKITLKGSNSTTDDVAIKGSGATTVTTDASGNIVINSADTKYSHPNSGVTAGTYKSVTVNAAGHVTAGTNPTTLSGYGITDAAAKSHTHANADITSIDASKITSGTISIDRLPKSALERLVTVADDTARFKLTNTNVQVGDTVKVTSSGKMYLVVDDTKLNVEAGYEVYTAGSAASVPWSGVTGKPSTFAPAAHNQAISTIDGLQTALDGKAASSHGTHVTYATVAGKAPGTAAVGTSSKVAREDHVHPLQTTVSGNAGTATKLATARNINVTGAVTASAASFDGSAAVNIVATSLNAAKLVLNSGDTLILDGNF